MNSQDLRLFLSPRPSDRMPNSYIRNLAIALGKKVKVVNGEKGTASWAGDLLRHGWRADVLVLNWPEEIIYLRYGMLQSLLFNSTIALYRLLGKKVIWIAHNRKTHHTNKQLLSKCNFRFFSGCAHSIVAHTRAAQQHFRKVAHKVHYLPHPRYDQQGQMPGPAGKAATDVLIWGTISSYKGLDQFIRSYKASKQAFRVQIAGSGDAGYIALLQELASGTNIALLPGFLTQEKLQQLFADTKIILLPYNGADTFSSGALVHSINAERIIIGPATGNFLDLQQADACLTYQSNKDLFARINHLLADHEAYRHTAEKLQQGCRQYYHSNSWDAFAASLLQLTTGKAYPAADTTAIGNREPGTIMDAAKLSGHKGETRSV